MVVGRRPRPEIVALPADELPSVAELFTFMRDAERRFETLKLRIEERTYGGRGEQLVTMDVALRHPGHARVVTTEPGTKAADPSGPLAKWTAAGCPGAPGGQLL